LNNLALPGSRWVASPDRPAGGTISSCAHSRATSKSGGSPPDLVVRLSIDELSDCRDSCTSVPELFETSQGLVVRPVVASEISRFDALLDEHHWLGRGLVGETLRHITVVDGEWVGLVGYGSPALPCSARDHFIGWSPTVRYWQLRYVANNQRFCILPAGR